MDSLTSPLFAAVRLGAAQVGGFWDLSTKLLNPSTSRRPRKMSTSKRRLRRCPTRLCCSRSKFKNFPGLLLSISLLPQQTEYGTFCSRGSRFFYNHEKSCNSEVSKLTVNVLDQNARCSPEYTFIRWTWLTQTFWENTVKGWFLQNQYIWVSITIMMI